MKAHTGAVTTLTYTGSTGLLASAGHDNFIHLFHISITPAKGNNIIRCYSIITFSLYLINLEYEFSFLFIDFICSHDMTGSTAQQRGRIIISAFRYF